MTRFVPSLDTAQNKEPDHATLCQEFSSEAFLEVQLIPSGDVSTLSPVPLEATAQNKVKLGDQSMLRQKLLAADVLDVQLVPFVDVITKLVDPLATAQNKDKSGDHTKSFHALLADAVLLPHLEA